MIACRTVLFVTVDGLDMAVFTVCSGTVRCGVRLRVRVQSPLQCLGPGVIDPE